MSVTAQQLADAGLDCAHIAEIATSLLPTAPDRLGRVKKTIAGLSLEFPDASSNAAAAQASADDALASQAAAAAAVVLAESARDAAVIGAGVYATEAAGRAAVADGVAFKVQGSGAVAAFEYRRTNAGASVLIATYPSSIAVNKPAWAGKINGWPDPFFYRY